MRRKKFLLQLHQAEYLGPPCPRMRRSPDAVGMAMRRHVKRKRHVPATWSCRKQLFTWRIAAFRRSRTFPSDYQRKPPACLPARQASVLGEASFLALILVVFLFTFSFFLAKPILAVPECDLPDNNPFKYDDEQVASCNPERNNPTIMRFFGTDLCSKCLRLKPLFVDAVSIYEAQGLVTSKVLDKPLPPEEDAICIEITGGYCPNPTTILGCHYYLMGDGGLSNEGYQQAIKEVIDCLLAAMPTPTPPPSFPLSSGWNRIVWPGGAGIKASDTPFVCPLAVARQNSWFLPYVKNFGGVNFEFAPGTYYLKCNQPVVWSP